MDSGNDDFRKKRDSTEVIEGDVVVNEEKTKKLRANRPSCSNSTASAQINTSTTCAQIAPSTAVSAQITSSEGTDTKLQLLPAHEINEVIERIYTAPVEVTCDETSASHAIDYDIATDVPSRQALDLEVALQRIVRMGDTDESKEYLSLTSWVNFRIGHAGDASALAACYRKSRCATDYHCRDNNCNDNKGGLQGAPAEDTSLEVMLAEGLGDEDTPPSICALLAHVESDVSAERKLGAAALVSTAWEDASRVLRVEWFYVFDDEDFADVANLLERRMWLRLSALALMTSCQMLAANGVTITLQAAPSTSEHVSTPFL